MHKKKDVNKSRILQLAKSLVQLHLYTLCYADLLQRYCMLCLKKGEGSDKGTARFLSRERRLKILAPLILGQRQGYMVKNILKAHVKEKYVMTSALATI